MFVCPWKYPVVRICDTRLKNEGCMPDAISKMSTPHNFLTRNEGKRKMKLDISTRALYLRLYDEECGALCSLISSLCSFSSHSSARFVRYRDCKFQNDVWASITEISDSGTSFADFGVHKHRSRRLLLVNQTRTPNRDMSFLSVSERSRSCWRHQWFKNAQFRQ